MKKKIIGLIDGQSGNIGSIKKAIKDIIKDKPYQLKIIQSQFDPNHFSKIIFELNNKLLRVFKIVFRK